MTACTTLPEVEGLEAQLQGKDYEGCTSSGCGDNGAVVDGSDISWFRLDHNPYKGIRYLHFATSQWNMNHGIFADNLDIKGNILRFGGPITWQTGPALLNTVIRVAVEKPTEPLRRYDIQIAGVYEDTPYWTQAFSGFAESYRFTWTALTPEDDTPERGELCPMDVSDDPWWNRAYRAVVFEGEKIDNETRNITSTGTADYVAPFNIACFGGLPAKQELARRTSASATVDGMYHTTIADDRQNLARAWAAEYCGGGESFTHQGHKLRIKDRHQWLSIPKLGWTEDDELSPDFQFEAVWSDGRAICVDTPRLAVTDPNIPPDPEIFDRIRSVCNLPPPCTGQSWFPKSWALHGDFATATFGAQDVLP
ncbi:MAG: ADYC domain-containing protein [Kofleriaceae bacterium]